MIAGLSMLYGSSEAGSISVGSVSCLQAMAAAHRITPVHVQGQVYAGHGTRADHRSSDVSSSMSHPAAKQMAKPESKL